MLISLTEHFKVDIDEKYYKLPKKFKDILFNGSDDDIEFEIIKLNKRFNVKRYINVTIE